MKTKNIFRMLLMAVVLLMGANNAKAQGPFAINYNVTEGKGTISTDKTSASPGETVTVTVTPDDGYSLKETIVRNDWYQTVELNNNQFIMPEMGVTVYAAFTAIDYNITNVAGEHGSFGTNMNNNIAHVGDIVELYINPEYQYEIDQITVTAEDGTNIEVADKKFTMPAQNVTVTVTFKTNAVTKYGVWNGNNTQNGGVWANTDSAEEGATITLSSNPNEGYELDYYSISTDGSTYNAIEGNTFTMPAGNVWYSATFKQVAQTKTDVTLSFPQQAYTATMGETFTAPTLTNESGVSVTYSSSNTGVATVDASTGAVTLVGAGETTITASFAGDDSYNATSAQYTLTVSAAQEPVVVEDGETTIWNDGPKAQGSGYWTIPGSAFSNAVETTKLCVYVNNSDGIYLTAASDWSNLWDGWTGQGGGEYKGTTYYNSTYNCFEFELGSFLSKLQAGGINVESKGSTIMSITLLNGEHTGEPAPVPTTYTVSIANGIQNGSVSANPANAEEGATVTLTVSPNDGYRLESLTVTDANGQAVAINNNQFTMPASNVTVSATFAQVQYTVSIANGIQNGSVSANPTNAEEGATVTLTVSPNDGYRLESLTVTDANGQAVAVNNNQFTMPASNVTVSATFAQVQSAEYTISINVTGEGSINLYRDLTAKEGEVITITAQGNQHYYELGVLTVVDADGNQITVTDNKFTMPASNVTINATFVAKKYTLTWTITGDDTPYLVQEVAYGETIANPEAPEREGFVFNGWEQHSETMPAYDLTINGSFSQIYNITLVYDETQGTVTIDKSQSLGNEELHLTITPNEGLQIASVTATDATGNLQVWNDYTTFRIGASDVTVTVTFKEADAVVYNVTNNNDAQNGRVWADVYQAVAGQIVNLGNQPNQGYELDYYVVTAGEQQIEVTNGQFTMPEGDVTISGVFKLGTFTITYYVDGQVVATQSYTYGDAIVLPEEPTKEGYTFNGWQNLNYQTMPGWNLQVYATFTQNGGGGGGQDTEDDTQYVNVTVGTTGYASFCSDKALDVTGLSVYYAESIDDENVTLKKLTGVVAAGTGLIVKGNSSIPVSNEAGTSPTGNLLMGVTSDTVAPAGAYVLVSRNGVATFAQTSEESTATVPAGKAYLVAPSGARYLNIVFDDNATGISTLKTKLTGDETIYNLRGLRVTNPTTGLYIVNGKKVFIK